MSACIYGFLRSCWQQTQTHALTPTHKHTHARTHYAATGTQTDEKLGIYNFPVAPLWSKPGEERHQLRKPERGVAVEGPAQGVAADEGGGGRDGEGGQEGASHQDIARDVAEVRAGGGARAEEKEGGGGGEGEGQGQGERDGEGKKEGERLGEGEGGDVGGYPVGRLGFRRQFASMLQQLVRFKPDLVGAPLPLPLSH